MPFQDDGEFEWVPPSPAEMKIIEAKRERNNQISRLMGDYMLKGYRMLDKLCEECGTILLLNRSDEFHCVACTELSSETSKDDPALSTTAALASVLEHQQKTNNFDAMSSCNSNGINAEPSAPATTKIQVSKSKVKGMNTDEVSSPHASDAVNQTIDEDDVNVSLIQSSRILPNTSKDQGMETDSPQKCNVGTSVVSNLCNYSSTPTNCNTFDFSLTISALNAKIMFFTEKLQNTNSANDTVKICKAIRSCAETLEAILKLK